MIFISPVVFTVAGITLAVVLCIVLLIYISVFIFKECLCKSESSDYDPRSLREIPITGSNRFDPHSFHANNIRI